MQVMMAPNPKGITVRDCCSSLHAPPIAQPTATRVLKALQIHFAVRCIFMESSLLLELYWPNRDNSGNSSSLLVVFRLDFPKVKSEYRQVTDVCVCVCVCGPGAVVETAGGKEKSQARCLLSVQRSQVASDVVSGK